MGWNGLRWMGSSSWDDIVFVGGNGTRGVGPSSFVGWDRPHGIGDLIRGLGSSW